MEFSNLLARIIFASTTLLLLFLTYMFYRQVEELILSYQKVNESNLVKLKLEQTISSLKDAETAQRGYLLTDDSLFLTPFFGSYENTRKLLNEVKEATADDAGQQNDLNNVHTFIEVRYRTFDNVIRQYKREELSKDVRKMHLLRGESSMDSIRYYVNSVQAAEDRKILAREKEKHKYSLLTPFIGFLIFIVGLGIMLFSYLRIMKDLHVSKLMLERVQELNEVLTEKNYELELYNKELDSFTYIASHDLKEPLRKIMTFTSLIEEKELGNLSDHGCLNFHRIRRAAGRMQLLLNDLLDYSHVTTQDKRFEEVDMNEVVKDVETKLADEIEDASAEISASRLPVLSGLGFQLTQLFENLISNALKYRKNGVPLRINIRASLVKKPGVVTMPAKSTGWYHKIVVEDNGTGFSPLYADKIFGLFQRVHSSDGEEGTGIGLTICKKIVQNHNGFIMAAGEVDKGARFEIYFPA